MCVRNKRSNYGQSLTYILFTYSTLLTIVSISYPDPSADNTPSSIGTIVTFVTHSNQCGGADIRVTDDTYSIVFITQAADGCCCIQ